MKPYRIYVGSIQQETNSFTSASASLADFDRLYGDEVLKKLSVSPLQREDIQIISGTYAHAVPSGTLSNDVFNVLLEELLESIPMNVDGVFLYVHGAMEVESVGSGDAAIVRAVRARVGMETKIAVAMDFHANVSPVLVQNADIICSYRTAPHVDMEETQERACSLLIDLLETNRTLHACLLHVPMLFTGDCVITENEPARSLLRSMLDIEGEDGVYAVTFCFGHPWVDTPWVGTSVTVYASNDEIAKNAAVRAARMWWNARRDFRFLTQTCLPDEALTIAEESTLKPVFLSDSGDNTTAGASGDRAGMLRRCLEYVGSMKMLVAGISDARALNKCILEGEGANVRLVIGGTLDSRHADVVEDDFTVISIGEMLGWYGENAGRRVLVRHGGVDVIITEFSCAVISPEIILTGGADAFDYDVVIVKLGYLYPELAAVAPKSVFVMTEGVSTARVETLHYDNVPRENYPANPNAELDEDSAYIKK